MFRNPFPNPMASSPFGDLEGRPVLANEFEAYALLET